VKAALIVGALVLVLVAGAVAVVVFAVDKAVDEFGEAPDDTYDLTLTSCTTTPAGTPEMTMRFTNRSGERRRFRVRAGYFDGTDQVGIDRSVVTGSLADGQSEDLTVLGGLTPPEGFTCRVTEVRFNGG
jgi:hypothetical protein